jgi:hypothetical protein
MSSPVDTLWSRVDGAVGKTLSTLAILPSTCTCAAISKFFVVTTKHLNGQELYDTDDSNRKA